MLEECKSQHFLPIKCFACLDAFSTLILKMTNVHNLLLCLHFRGVCDKPVIYNSNLIYS